MDVITSVSMATSLQDMNSSPYETSDQDQVIFRTPETQQSIPCSNTLSVKIDKNNGQLNTSQTSSPNSVYTNSPLSDPLISSTSNINDSDINAFTSTHEFSPFSSVANSKIGSLGNNEMDQYLTCSVSTSMAPRSNSPQDSLISSPVNINDTILSSPESIHNMESTNPEYTLIDRAGRFNINDADSHVRFGAGMDHGFDQLLDYVVTDSDSHKVPKVRRDSDAPSSINKEDVTVDKLFEADLANSTAEFSFNKFGSEVSQGIFTFSANKSTVAETTSTPATFIVTSAISTPICEIVKTPITPVTRSQRGGRHLKEPSLCQQYPSRTDKYEVRILEQPEEQHRARYLTEGSRGAIKNVSQEGNPVVKLFGDVDHATLQVFIGNDQGRVKPHAFYQACKVCGKNSTPCQEREIDGTIVIEMEMDTVNDKTCSIDNVGILKLRNADVENRVGIQKAKKKSTKARLIFRVQFQKPDGNIQILQIASRSINCTQPIGQPEICKMSLRECTVNGNAELIMIGKNFMKGTKVFFQEIDGDDGPVIWEKESEIDKDFFQPTHLVCTAPAYQDTCVSNKVNVQVVVRCSGKQSEPQTFTYMPVLQVKQETPMETDEQQVQKPGPMNITVAPEALRLNQQLQESLASSHGKFMLPDGAVSGITSMQVDEENSQKEKEPDQTNITEQASSLETKSNTEDHGDRSLSKDNIEPIQMNTSDLHSILKYLDDKPMSINEILGTPNNGQFGSDSSSPAQVQQPFTEGRTTTSLPQVTLADSGFNSTNVNPPHQQVNSPLYNILPNPPSSGFNDVNNFGNQNTETISKQNIQGYAENVTGYQPNYVQSSNKFPPTMDPNPQTFQQVVSPQQEFTNNPTSVPGFPTGVTNIPSEQINIGGNQKEEQNIGNILTSPNVQEFSSSFNHALGSHEGETVQASNQILQSFQGTNVPSENTDNMTYQNSATVQHFPIIQNQMSQIHTTIPVHASNIESFGNSQNAASNLIGQQSLSHFPVVVSSIQTPQCSTQPVNTTQSLIVTTNSSSFASGLQAFGNTVSSNSNSSPQVGYSDIAMKFLQQLMTKSTNSDMSSTNHFNNSSQNTNNSTSASLLSEIGVQNNLAPLNIPTTLLQHQVSVSTSSPKVSASHGILHQMLSQELDKPNLPLSPPVSIVGGKPAVQQLDSLRLQAMAQQVQQQAQMTQQTSNGNSQQGPQIIVLGGNSGGQQNNQSNTSSAAAPSILILPGGNGDSSNTTGNPQSQVEYILRSILGSLKPESK